jgi:hypothetical protein
MTTTTWPLVAPLLLLLFIPLLHARGEDRMCISYVYFKCVNERWNKCRDAARRPCMEWRWLLNGIMFSWFICTPRSIVKRYLIAELARSLHDIPSRCLNKEWQNMEELLLQVSTRLFIVACARSGNMDMGAWAMDRFIYIVYAPGITWPCVKRRFAFELPKAPRLLCLSWFCCVLIDVRHNFWESFKRILTLHYVKHVRQRLWHVRNAMPAAASIGRVWRRLCTWIATSSYFAKTHRLAEAICNLASWYRVLTLLRVALPPWSSLAWFQDVSRLFTLQSSGAFATWERPACFHQECHHTPGVKFTDRHCFAWGTGRSWSKEV